MIFEVAFSRETGWLSAYNWQQQAMMKSPLEPHFWRAATDNDIGNSQQIRCAVWKDVLQTARIDSLKIDTTNKKQVTIRTWHYLPAVKAVYKARVYSNGRWSNKHQHSDEIRERSYAGAAAIRYAHDPARSIRSGEVAGPRPTLIIMPTGKLLQLLMYTA